VKGAPEVLLERAARILEGGTERPLEARDRAAFQAAYEAMAARGLRTLALARRALPGAPPPEADALERDLTLLGLVGIIDPPRPEVPGAVALAHAAGIRVLMLTGDAPGTARAVADQIGLTPTRTITGSELEQMDDAALAAALGDEVLFARTAPEHKLRLVRALQARGEVVAMTGDGVNDAPALKRADIGVAMGVRGTDVARAAADIVLADDDFASIVSAAEEGRRQHANIRRFVRYLLSSNTGEVLAIFVALVSGAGLLLLPVQILWMNLMTDSVTAVALGLEPAHPGTMRRPPRKRGSPILPGRDMPWVAVLGAAIAAVTLAVFWLWGAGVGPGRVQTAAFTAIIVAEKINVLNFRALRAPMRSVGWFTNPWLLVALVCTLGVQACAVYVPFLQRALHTVPLPALDWLWFLLFAIPIFLVPEALKRHLAARA
jgi:Ca2+-transporting ATPase